MSRRNYGYYKKIAQTARISECSLSPQGVPQTDEDTRERKAKSYVARNLINCTRRTEDSQDKVSTNQNRQNRTRP
jgi:hypothetical protein